MRTDVRSFDVFDTLIARRDIHPRAVFHKVEARSGTANFATMRIASEAVARRCADYSFDDIYNVLVTRFGIASTDAQRLQELELEVEREQYVPIRRNCDAVRPGDVFVSDMYLPQSFIAEAIATTCNLEGNPLYVSARGKCSGRIWRSLRSRFRITRHLGDNLHSDVAMPMLHGIAARWSTISRRTRAETLVERLGYGSLARACRVARLGRHDTDPKLQRLIEAQIGLNFPLLYVAALCLIRCGLRNGWTNFLFSSRDCYLLHRIFTHLVARLGLPWRATYFLTSRVARSYPSEAYQRYFHALCGDEPTVVVDICGFGLSLSRLFNATGRVNTPIFLVQYMPHLCRFAWYRKLHGIKDWPSITGLVNIADNLTLEALNPAEHAMVVDVIDTAGAFQPVYANLPQSTRSADFSRSLIDAFDSALTSAASIPDSDLKAWLTTVDRRHVASIIRALTWSLRAVAPIRAQQITENMAVGTILASRRAASRPTAVI